MNKTASAAALALVFTLAQAPALAGRFDPSVSSRIGEGGGDFSFAVMADNQPWADAKDSVTQNEHFRGIQKRINSRKHDFVVMCGDLVRGYTNIETRLKEWEGFDRAAADFKMPYVAVPGNHDISDLETQRIWETRHGPLWFSWDHKGCHFIALDSEVAGQKGTISGEQLKWLESDLEAAKGANRIFVFIHNPLWNIKPRKGEEANSWMASVHPLLAKYGVDTVFAGHFHAYIAYPEKDGVRYVITGPAGGDLGDFCAFTHFLLVSVKGKSANHRIITLDKEYPAGLITAEAERAFKEAFKENLDPPGEDGKAAVRINIRNEFNRDLNVSLSLKTEGTSWKPAARRFVVKPRSEKTLALETRIEDGLFPPPKLLTKVSLGDLVIKEGWDYVYVPFSVAGHPRVIDDFEDGDLVNLCAVSGISRTEGNRWWSQVDEHGESKVSDFAVEEIPDGIDGSRRAGHVKGFLARPASGKPTRAMFFSGLSSTWAGVDLSGTLGLSFLAKSSTGSRIALGLGDYNTSGEYFRKSVDLTEEWTRYVVSWDEFAQPDSVKPEDRAPAPYKPESVYLFNFVILDEGKEFDVWLDDFKLICGRE